MQEECERVSRMAGGWPRGPRREVKGRGRWWKMLKDERMEHLPLCCPVRGRRREMDKVVDVKTPLMKVGSPREMDDVWKRGRKKGRKEAAKLEITGCLFVLGFG